jgi:hypothetical protein
MAAISAADRPTKALPIHGCSTRKQITCVTLNGAVERALGVLLIERLLQSWLLRSQWEL